MTEKTVLITHSDAERLVALLEATQSAVHRDRTAAAPLAEELRRARRVASDAVPADVVTMNSRFVVTDLDSRRDMEFALVYPADANADEGRISVLSPVGTAVLGYAEGDVIEWPVPAGRRRFRISKVVFQPEAAGLRERGAATA